MWAKSDIQKSIATGLGIAVEKKVPPCKVNGLANCPLALFYPVLKGVQHPWALFLKTLYIFSKNKATLDKVSYRSALPGQKCSKEHKNYSFTLAESIVVKLQ